MVVSGSSSLKVLQAAAVSVTVLANCYAYCKVCVSEQCSVAGSKHLRLLQVHSDAASFAVAVVSARSVAADAAKLLRAIAA